MRFYVGVHQPSDTRHFDRAFVSVRRLRRRRSLPAAGRKRALTRRDAARPVANRSRIGYIEGWTMPESNRPGETSSGPPGHQSWPADRSHPQEVDASWG